MKTISDILTEVTQQNLQNRCVFANQEEQLVFNRYTISENLEAKVERVLENKESRYNYLMGLTHIQYDETNDKFLFVTNLFKKTITDWQWIEEVINFEWVKVENEYMISSTGNEILINKFQTLLPKITLT